MSVGFHSTTTGAKRGSSPACPCTGVPPCRLPPLAPPAAFRCNGSVGVAGGRPTPARPPYEESAWVRVSWWSMTSR